MGLTVSYGANIHYSIFIHDFEFDHKRQYDDDTPVALARFANKLRIFGELTIDLVGDGPYEMPHSRCQPESR